MLAIQNRPNFQTGRLLLLLLSLICMVSCSPPAQETKSQIRVVTTVSMVSDLVRQIGGDRVEVQSLMGPGVDPHLYKATTADLAKLRDADVVFYSGLLLEGKMQDILIRLAQKKPTYAVTDSIPKNKLLNPPEFSGHHDPHVWFEVPLWSLCVDTVVKGLSDHSPANKAYFEKRGSDYKATLAELHDWIVEKCGELPVEKRILATSHDAFNYFGSQYNFKVVGLQGISTVSEASLSDVVKMVEFIRENGVKAVFVESSVPHKTIERVSQDAGVKIGGELYSDATGTPGQIENGYDLGTYEGMIRHNVLTIVEALK